MHVGSHLSDFFARAGDASASFPFVRLGTTKTDVLEPTRLRVGATVRTKIPTETKLLVRRRTTINSTEGG